MLIKFRLGKAKEEDELQGWGSVVGMPSPSIPNYDLKNSAQKSWCFHLSETSDKAEQLRG